MSLSAHELAIRAGLAASRRLAGVPVTYSRDSSDLTISQAIEGETRFGTMSHSGSESVVEFVDWLIHAADLTFGEPAIGDTIKRTIDGTDYTYTVEAMEMGLNPWDWSDTGRTQYRIRTRKDGSGEGSGFEVSTPNGFDISGNEIRYE